MSETVRVRFAPSPTGYLHVGGARTALFNWLFARNRVENSSSALKTPTALGTMSRPSKTLNETSNGWEWIGMKAPKGGEYGPYVQSERLEIYKKHANELVQKGLAYHCFCTSERLEKVREQQKQKVEQPDMTVTVAP